MKDELEEFIKELVNLEEYSEYGFRKCCGLTFVFKSTFFRFHEKISSAEIRPVGIIYEENDEIYFAPLDEVDEIEPIVEEFVNYCLG